MARRLVASTIKLMLVPLSTTALADGRASDAIWLAQVLSPGAARLLGITEPAQAPAALDRPFDDPIVITVKGPTETSHATPLHCRALLELEPSIAGTMPASDWPVLQQALADCQALQWLARVTAPIRTALPAQAKGAQETRLWPAATWPATSPEGREALLRSGQSLADVSGRRWWQARSNATAKDIPALHLRTDDHELNVQWLARGDFDGDGWEDWLLRWQAHAVGGSWRAARTLLLTRKNPTAMFEIREDPAPP